MRHYPSHLSHVATIPWDINNSIFPQIFLLLFLLKEYVSQIHYSVSQRRFCLLTL